MSVRFGTLTTGGGQLTRGRRAFARTSAGAIEAIRAEIPVRHVNVSASAGAASRTGSGRCRPSRWWHRSRRGRLPHGQALRIIRRAFTLAWTLPAPHDEAQNGTDPADYGFCGRYPQSLSGLHAGDYASLIPFGCRVCVFFCTTSRKCLPGDSDCCAQLYGVELQ